MRIWLAAALTFTALLITFLFLGVDPLAARALRTKLQHQLAKDCPRCTLRIGDLRVSVYSGELTTTDLDYRSDPKKDTTYHFAAERLHVRVSPLSLLRKKPWIREIEVFRPSVTIHEIQGQPPSPRPDYPSPGYAFRAFPPARIGGILIHDGIFTYESERDGRIGRITVRDIDGRVNGFATRERLLTRTERHPVHMDASAKLENSGIVGFHVRFDPYAEINHDTIRIELKGQKMDELNRFFGPDSGLTFQGFLELAKADLSLNSGHLSGTLTGAYQGLHLKFHSNPGHGKISSTFKNVISSLTTEKSVAKKEEPVSQQRKPKEPITHLLIEGLKDAAKKIITS